MGRRSRFPPEVFITVLVVAWTAPWLIQRERPRGSLPPERGLASLASSLDRRPDCILGAYRPTSGSFQRQESRTARLVLRQGERTSPLSISSEESPSLIWVKRECRALLEQAAESTLQDENRDLGSRATFPFLPSHPTTYCGVPPSEWQGCAGFTLKNDGEAISRISRESGQIPLALQSIVGQLVSTRVSTEEGAEDERLRRQISQRLSDGRDRLTYYVIEGETPGITPLELQVPNPNPRDRNPWVTAGEIAYVRLNRYDGHPAWRTIEAPEAKRMIQASLRRAGTHGNLIPALGPSRFNRRVIERIDEIAQRISQYWQNALEFLNNPQTPNPDLSVFELGNIPSELLQEGRLDRHAEQAIHRITTAAVTEASLGLEGASNMSAILTAASYWWAARSVQIAFGCAPEQPLRELVEEQYGHQQCRRIFARRSYQGLNRQIETGGELDITTREWMLVFAIGSRIERAQNLSRALPLLIQQLERNIFPSRSTLSLITFETLQVAEELRASKTLTWNGLQPMTPSQRGALTQLRQNLREFFPALARVSISYRLRDPELHETVNHAWRRVASQLELGPFPSPGRKALALLERDEAEKIIQEIQRLPQGDTSALQRLLAASDPAMAGSQTHSASICQAWVQALPRVAAPQISLIGNYQSRCARLIVQQLGAPPAERPHSGAPLEDECLRLENPAACLFLPEISNNLRLVIPDPMAWAGEVTRVGPKKTRLLRALIRLHRKALEESRREPSRFRAFQRASIAIHHRLRSRYQEVAQLLPREREIQNCFDPEEWARQLEGEHPPAPEQILRSLHPDCRTGERFVPFWAETVLACRAVQRSIPVDASLFAPVETYAFWLNQMDAFKRLLPRDRISLEAGQTVEVSLALNDLFVNLRNRSSHFPYRIPVVCHTPDRDSATKGFRYAEAVGSALSTIRDWEIFNRPSLGGPPTTEPDSDQGTPLVF